MVNDDSREELAANEANWTPRPIQPGEIMKNAIAMGNVSDALRIVLAKVWDLKPHGNRFFHADNYRMSLTEHGPVVTGHTQNELREKLYGVLDSNPDVVDAILKESQEQFLKDIAAGKYKK